MASDLLPGGGRYVVKGVLGEGAQGTTYDATEAATGRSVAIKRFDVRGAGSWKDVELAMRESRVLASLDHPLVPRYVEHFEEDGALYLVMEKIEGDTLEALRTRQGPMPEAEVRRFLASADRALTYLHGRGAPVVHRDIKPRNVLRRTDGSYVLVDFGVVSESLRRGSSTVVGTMGYMAPEQLQGRALPTSDVYAVGATALAALTGVEPETLPHRGLRVDVRGVLGGRVSPDLVTSLERMLEPDPDLRARSVGAALDVAATASGPSPRGPVRVEPSDDDAAVRSLRGLLWALWGIGWIIVPLVFSRWLRLPGESIPIAMFGWLALNLILSWHRGALLRAGIRYLRAEGARATLPARVRVDAVAPADARPQVRVHTAELRPEEVVGGTDVQTSDELVPPRRSGRGS